MTVAAARPRRTQAERSRATRERLVTVTLDLLYERGLRETSTVDIAQRAGVSRGAMLHHFPTKEDLLKEALRLLLNRETEAIRAMAAAIDAGDMDLDGFLDALWEKFSGPLFMITLEYVTTARTNRAILEALQPIAKDFNDSLDEIWERFFVHSGISPEERRHALTATLCLLRGMGTQSVWRHDPAFFEDMLAYWKRMVLATVFARHDLRRPACPPDHPGAVDD